MWFQFSNIWLQFGGVYFWGLMPYSLFGRLWYFCYFIHLQPTKAQKFPSRPEFPTLQTGWLNSSPFSIMLVAKIRQIPTLYESYLWGQRMGIMLYRLFFNVLFGNHFKLTEKRHKETQYPLCPDLRWLISTNCLPIPKENLSKKRGQDVSENIGQPRAHLQVQSEHGSLRYPIMGIFWLLARNFLSSLRVRGYLISRHVDCLGVTSPWFS